MHHGQHGQHFGGGGPWMRRRGFMRPFPNREELIERLESYQRDLEQELANLDDVLRHLRGGQGSGAPQEV